MNENDLQQSDLTVTRLGPCRFDSPIEYESASVETISHFVTDQMRIRNSAKTHPDGETNPDLTFEESGPCEKIFFDPARTTAAVVTCGGLSPGLNNVVRSVFYELTENYGVRRVLGIRNGYLGLTAEAALEPVVLTRDYVGMIDKLGGTVLGTSRGAQDPGAMVAYLKQGGIDILFCIGGDGTQRGAHALQKEIQQQGLPLSIIGIPKTIDNDIPFVTTTFGYVTALEKASEVIRAAHVEACGAVNGIGLVKLMGRDAGFVAAGATVVSQESNFTLVPEIPFPIDGEDGFLASLQRRMQRRGHAVVVVAEGAGQHLFDQSCMRRDASGNVLHEDIGTFLRGRINQHFAERGMPVSIKYFDPSYHIRSVPANAFDRFLCDQLARNAVHAAMAGKTGMFIGYLHNECINVPIPIAVGQRKRMCVSSDLWRSVLQVTRQPRW